MGPLPAAVILIQYVDDLLMPEETKEGCLNATHQLLLHLYRPGFKVNRKKIQVCRRSV